jgi:hypothetical protein
LERLDAALDHVQDTLLESLTPAEREGLVRLLAKLTGQGRAPGHP